VIPLVLLLLALSLPVPALEAKDDTGTRVILNAPARRIVTLAPHATELILALGQEERLVAVAPYSEVPPALTDLPRLGGLGGLDRERLLQLQPDLVVAWGSGNRPGDLHWLRRAGIALYVTEPRTLDDIARALLDLGRLTGDPAAGRQAAARFRRRLDTACPSKGTQARRPVYYEIWPSPPMTIGGRHWLNDLLKRAGLRNIFDDVPRGLITVSRESILARPHELTLSTSGRGDLPLDATLGRPGPRIVEGLEKLCDRL